MVLHACACTVRVCLVALPLLLDTTGGKGLAWLWERSAMLFLRR